MYDIISRVIKVSRSSKKVTRKSHAANDRKACQQTAHNEVKNNITDIACDCPVYVDIKHTCSIRTVIFLYLQASSWILFGVFTIHVSQMALHLRYRRKCTMGSGFTSFVEIEVDSPGHWARRVSFTILICILYQLYDVICKMCLFACV